MTRAPLNAQRQAVLLSRANCWGLQKVAYRLSKKQAQKYVRSPDAQLVCGMAMRYYAEDQFFNNKKNSVVLFGQMMLVIRHQLSESLRMNPKSTLPNLVYGFWMWQFDGRMDEGLRLVKKAHSINPLHVGAIATLGDMYSNASGNCYDARQAEQMLKLAIKMDPNYAYPKVMLVSLLCKKKRYKEAKKYMKDYVKVIPEEFSESPSVRLWEKQISQK